MAIPEIVIRELKAELDARIQTTLEVLKDLRSGPEDITASRFKLFCFEDIRALVDFLEAEPENDEEN